MTSTASMLLQRQPNLSDFATSAGCLNSCAAANVSNPYEGQCKWNGMNTALVSSLAVTLLLNVFASVILFRVPLVTVRGRSNPVYLCIRFLNISDVAQSLLLLVMPAFADPNCVWFGGDICCSIMGFMALFLLLASPLITILMAFDRVIALYQPFKYRSHLGLKMLKVLLPSACAVVFIITMLPIIGVGEYHVVRGRRMCLLDTITDDPVDKAYVLVVHCIFLAALVFMAACTVTFQVKLFRMSFDKKHKSATKRRASGRRTRNATITTMAVCCIFVFCYLPYVARVLSETSTGIKSRTLLTWITFGLAFLQPLLNPVVYVATNVRYRQEFQILIRNMKSSDVDSSTDSQNGTSKGTFSGFRRRISSHRGSGKRGSQKAKGSQASLTSPNTNKPHREGSGKKHVDRFVNKCAANRIASCSDHPQEEPLTGTNIVRQSSFEHRRTMATVRREPSTSSGVKSFDSHEHLASPPGNFKQQLVANFGRLGRFSEEDPANLTPDSMSRERSNTVSGDVSPAARLPTTTYQANVYSNSVPLLTQDLEVEVSTEIRALEKSPGVLRRSFERGRDDPDKLGAALQKSENRSSEYVSCSNDENSAKSSSAASSLASGVVHIQAEVIAQIYGEKPRHRDSGVGETSDATVT